ncbi:MAG TPA: twin-arginine translocase subunit TatC, partial [Myxococcota bacterium]|nr:twin-arginine translocase subunit TatC [Myxococcota bacterium]
QPLAVLPSQKMIVLGPLEMFITYIKLSILAAVLVSSPFILLQLWLFVSPGLYAHEKRWVVPFVVLGTLFFVGGAAFCFYLVLPASFKYLIDMVPMSVEAHYSVSLYFSLVIQLMLAFGVVFELPLVMTLLGAAGVVSAEGFAGFRKYWVVIAAIIGGVLTPTPDPMTQMMMAVPLIVFFELGIIGARLTRRKRGRVDVAATVGAKA